MVVLASPVYYHGFSGQLQCAINRIYALGYPRRLKKAMLILSSGDAGVYDGAVYAYRHSFVEYLHLEDMGVFTAAGDENKSEELLERLRAAGAALADPDDRNVARLRIEAGDVTVRARMGDSYAARDLMNRLPLTVSARDTGVEYQLELKRLTVDESEAKTGTAAGDVCVCEGMLSIRYAADGTCVAPHQTVARLDDADVRLIQSLPEAVEMRLSLEEPYRQGRA